MTDRAPPSRDSRANLPFVLRELLARRATGVLAVTTSDAVGEIRLRLGHIEDAVLGRADGIKALARMLAASELRLAFRDTNEGWLRRIERTSDDVLAAATTTRDALVVALGPFESRRDSYAIALDLPEEKRNELSAAARAIWSRLRTPTSLSEMLDLATEDDVAILVAAGELEAAGGLRWLAFESERQPLGPARWETARLRERLGPTPRLVVAGTPHRLAIFAHALLYVDDVVRPTAEPPLVPMPHVVASITIESMSLDVAVCPLVPVYSPLWPLALASAALVVRLDEAAAGILESACDLVGARVVDAEVLVGPLDEARVGAVAALIRAALDDAVS